VKQKKKTPQEIEEILNKMEFSRIGKERMREKFLSVDPDRTNDYYEKKEYK